MNNNNENKNFIGLLSLNEIKENYNKVEKSLFFFSKNTCPYCPPAKKLLNNLSFENLKIFEINLSNFTPEDVEEIFNILDHEIFCLPSAILINKTKNIKSFFGFSNKNLQNLQKLFINNDVKCEIKNAKE